MSSQKELATPASLSIRISYEDDLNTVFRSFEELGYPVDDFSAKDLHHIFLFYNEYMSRKGEIISSTKGRRVMLAWMDSGCYFEYHEGYAMSLSNQPLSRDGKGRYIFHDRELYKIVEMLRATTRISHEHECESPASSSQR